MDGDPTFFQELQRRRVPGAVVTYAALAAGSLQLADILRSAFDLPGWTIKVFIAACGLGLPLTAAVSWFYDLTRHGLVRTVAPPARKPAPGAAQGPALPQGVLPPPRPRTPPPAIPGSGRAASEALIAGTTIAGRYTVLHEIARGGMGRVLAARDDKLGRTVAIKVLTDAYEPEKVRRFETEARAAGSLLHPNVLGIFDVGDDAGVPFLVCELLKGRTLKAELAKGACSIPAALEWARQLARGLAAAHAHGVVHRDLKPENLFLTESGVLKILDFGLAKLAEVEAGQELTPSGSIFGTPGYLSPEQARGQRADPRSDVFAAGAVIYEMLSGTRAFPGATLVDAGVAAITREPPQLPREVPPGLVDAVRRALQKDPARRYPHAGQLLAALDALGADQAQARPSPARKASAPGTPQPQPARAPGTPPPQGKGSGRGATLAAHQPQKPTARATPTPEVPLVDPDALAVGLRAERFKSMESGVALDDDSDLPFRRCGSCESDSHRTATLCAQCGSALDTPEQEAYNRAYWVKRRSEEQAAAQPGADAG